MSVITQAFSDAFQLLASGDEETFAAVQATLSTSGLAMLGCIIPGVPLGFLLGYTRFPGRNMLRILVDTALSFPTVVLGLLVYLLLARQGPFADFELLFTVPGIAIGLALLGLPIVIAHTCLAVEQADRLLAPTLRTLGAGPWQLLFSTVRELRFHLLTACITAFGRVVSEVGISMLVGGNIKWATRTITTAITLETGKGDYARSIALGIVLVALAFVLIWALPPCAGGWAHDPALPSGKHRPELSRSRKPRSPCRPHRPEPFRTGHPRREILGIRGHNGSGKSTLLRIIALLEPPDSGTVLFEGRPAGTDDLHLRRQVTLLLQTPYLLSRSVASNVAYGLRVRGIRNASELQNRIAASLLAVGLDPAVFLHRRRHELSGGECQRVALAARLALRPRVLLMDEPTASVDQQSAERIALAARHAADSGSAVVVVSHDHEWITPLSDRLVTLREGKLVE